MVKVEKETQAKFSKYERARMLGSRSLQIAMGAPFFVKIDEDELRRIRFDPLAIAKREFSEGVIPITVKRPMPEGLKVVEEISDEDEDVDVSDFKI